MTPVLRRSCGYPNKAAWWRFVFYLLAVAMGIDLGCSPGGFGFRASDFITGGGLAAGLLLRRRSVGPRWWLLQLNQGLESAIGGSGGAGVGGGDRPGDERKMYRSPRDFLVIFFFFLYLVENGGMYCASH